MYNLNKLPRKKQIHFESISTIVYYIFERVTSFLRNNAFSVGVTLLKRVFADSLINCSAAVSRCVSFFGNFFVLIVHVAGLIKCTVSTSSHWQKIWYA